MRWLVATVAETVPETARAVTLRLDVPGWPGHRAGQHVDVRLTAEDGYSTQRSYSIASPPGSERLELTVERIDDGEVSPYLTTVADLGDQFELRGPIGGWFVWDGTDTAPVLLVGGGSGVVPLRAILRHHAASGSTAAVHLVYSARTLGDLISHRDPEALAAPPAGGDPDPHAGVGAGLGRAPGPRRCRLARRGGLAAVGAAALLRVRAHRVRRTGRRRPGGIGP